MAGVTDICLPRKNLPRRINNGIIISPHYEDVAYPITMSPPLTASAFNQLQPVCYTELAVSSQRWPKPPPVNIAPAHREMASLSGPVTWDDKPAKGDTNRTNRAGLSLMDLA